ncbi:MAG: DNA-directed RNA polymerase subunit beta [Candidatus Abyssobacteria bacterium SURF_17]|uniref:DNA-directed RNA polymerase subunit beta n=1 Tax=Candidatus Abyssobacteria bacterium SURF_17 TaxID=2093361 RepID=A0A419EXH7_9BACT|nr:MAG: DNA-directed RNA polymerase subunit beta [Candidatus Abyssubacteria bacterium SURF_17]
MASKKATAAERYSFAKIPDIIELPNLIEIQRESYDNFLQMDKPPESRANEGLQSVFTDVFPIVSHDGLSSLEFVSYSLSPPKYSVTECQKRGMTYAASLKAKIRLVLYEEDPSGKKVPIAIKEQDVFVGELPLMTEKGTFIINGAERVVVSQLHRSPGVCFEEKQHPSGRMLLSGRIIPYRGAWVEFEFDINDVLYMHIDRRTRIVATAFLRALGYEPDEDILGLFYEFELVRLGQVKAMTEGSRFDINELVDRILAKDVVDVSTGEVIAHSREKITPRLLATMQEKGVKEASLIKFKSPNETTALLKTLDADHMKTTTEALIEVYRRIRPGDPATVNTAKTLFEKTFFDPSRYNLSPVGRYKINRKLNLDIPMETLTLRPEDVIETIRYLLELKSGKGQIDDIDHLGNRRVRSVGELLANQIRIGLVRMERTIKERMNFQEMDAVTPQSLINPKPVSAVIKDFFGRSQLSHFMDQTNPLAELTHKRRLSALGPGGLSRERAGFEVRDVHFTHYGRICPVETPEGPNIGLMASLSTFARINKFGFLETPYRKVEKGKVTDRVEYLSAYEEDRYVIAQANAPLDRHNRFVNELVLCRHMGDFKLISGDKIDYMDVSPKQLVSIAAALVPFLEHDDANRALMGSNMQRQAVPLLTPDAPLVGTGLEFITAKNSGAVVVAQHAGTVESVTTERIIVRRRSGTGAGDGAQEDIYWLHKFVRSNQGTCINQRPIVREGDRVKKGDIIADGPATSGGELALGQNVLVAFMPWEGYNFEDAILVSERLVKNDIFTSIHIEEFEIEARDTKLGREEITADIPNVSEEALKDLDEDGIIRIGAEVQHGDILVGKVSPKGETELAPEEKLLRAIFGEKAENVRDSSLRVPPGIEGTVIDVKVFSRKERSQGEKAKVSEKREQKKIEQRYSYEIIRLHAECMEAAKKLLDGARASKDVIDGKTEDVVFKQRHIIRGEDLDKADYAHLFQLKVSDKDIQGGLEKLLFQTQERENRLLAEKEQSLELLKKGDELPPGVIKMVKVYVAAKRKLSVGDKMAGRHGNKGVVAKILPEEDMPFLPDGTPVDVILNPLGVPSRMNVGQILETHLGWAAQKLNMQMSSPVFSGASEQEIKAFLKKAGLPEDGKTLLYDGRAGRPFDQKVTVGYIYMMKLAHLVDDKIHARAIGPYSLVTQQPLGGKAQFGGQRFGEMEVWALEAYGAANILQELLTIKSDDVTGRAKAYEAIVKGQQHLETGTPESFNVLLKEMQGLCLDVQKLKKAESSKEDTPPRITDALGGDLS